MPYDTNKPVPFGGLDDKDSMLLEDVQSPNMRNVRLDRDRVVRGPGAALFAEAPIPGTTVGAGVVTGSFTKQAGTGVQSVAHQLGTTPLAAIFFGNAFAASSSTTSTQFTMFHGMTDGTVSRCMSQAVAHGSTTTNGVKSWQTVPITIVSTAGTTASQASFSAWDASTFSLDWTTNDGVAGTIHYILFGATGMSAEVLPWTANTSTGNQVVGTTAFTPDVVFHMSSSQTTTGIATTNSRSALGVMCADGTQAAVSFATDDDNADGTLFDTERGSSDNATILLTQAPADIAGGVDGYATFVAMSGTGFTVNWGNAPGSAWLMASLCVDGLSEAKVLKAVRASGSVPYSQSVTGYPAEPDFLYALSAWTNVDSVTSTDRTAARTGIGAATPGQTGRSVAVASQGDVGTTVSRTFSATDSLLSEVTASAGTVTLKGRLASVSATGFTVDWIIASGTANEAFYTLALSVASSIASEVGVIRNYAQGYTGTTGTEKVLMLSSKTVSVYNSSTEVFDVSSESYTITEGRRFYVANTQDVMVWAVDATASAPNLRQYDGSTFSDLVTSGTNHKARFAIAFNDRIISGYTYHTGSVHPTQIRWCRSGQVNNWDTSTGSAGVLEVLETSNAPLTGMFVMGERAYITKQREIIELIPTGTTSPVFRQQTRIFGTGCIAPYSFGFGEFFCFFLGPDDVYLFDGSNIQSIGEPVRRTISALLDYNSLDEVQGEYLQSSAEYWLRIGNDIFVYDFRRKRWERDFYADQTAIGRLRVGGILTTDVDHSEFMVMGTTGNETLRISENQNTILGGTIDSYIETKDFYATRPTRGGSAGAVTALRSRNVTRSLAVQTDPGSMLEIGISTDRGATWDAVNVTADSQGIAQRWCNANYSVIRFRFRSTTTETFRVYGAYSWRWDTAGMVIGP